MQCYNFKSILNIFDGTLFNAILNDKIDILKGSNKHYQQTNRILINTNRNLSNKEY